MAFANVLRSKRIVSAVVTLVAFNLSGCLPETHKIPKTKDDIKIVSGFLGQEQLFVPYAYFKNGMADFNEGEVSLEMIQPEFLPLQKNQGQMWKDGDQAKYISILANEHRLKEEFSSYVNTRLGHVYALKKLGSEYGLTHFTQPEGYVQDWADVWVERKGKENISYIACDDNSVPVPQCTHALEIGTIYVQIHYDKRDLPNWRRIQGGVVELIQSFKAEDTARDLLFQKYVDYQSKNTKVVE